MGYKVDYKPHWIHVEYYDYVDAYEVIRQINDEVFWASLSRLKKVVFDYTHAGQIQISLEDLKHFAAIARGQADLIGPVDVVAVITNPDRMENALTYKKYSESPNWRVYITTSLEQAESLLNRLSIG